MTKFFTILGKEMVQKLWLLVTMSVLFIAGIVTLCLGISYIKDLSKSEGLVSGLVVSSVIELLIAITIFIIFCVKAGKNKEI